MLFYSSTLSSDKSRNSILFFRKDFVIQKVIVSEFNFGRHGRTVESCSKSFSDSTQFDDHCFKALKHSLMSSFVFARKFDDRN